MDDDGFSEKVLGLYKQRQELNCPSMECKALKEVVLGSGAVDAYELCLSISALLLLNDIELSTEVLADLVTLVSRNIIKYNNKTTMSAFEICQACSMSKLMDTKDVQ